MLSTPRTSVSMEYGEDPALEVTGQFAPGRAATLTEEETVLFKDMWTYVLSALDVLPSDVFTMSMLSPTLSNSTTKTSKTARTFRRKRNLFRKKPKTCQDPHAFRNALKSVTVDELRTALMFMARQISLDDLLVSFLRYRNWDVTKALKLLAESVHWRVKVFQVDKLMAGGEEHALLSGDEGLTLQYEMGKAVIYGTDRVGRPIVRIRVRHHDPKGQSEAALERYTVMTCENTRMMLTDRADEAVLIFDMTDFTLKNMDWPFVKFLIKCVQTYYPNVLGAVYIHKAPRVMGAIWDIVKGWLEPQNAKLVTFTHHDRDLHHAIDPENLSMELSGREKFDYRYIPPQVGENELIKDSETRFELLAQRAELAQQLYDLTADWIRTPYIEGIPFNARRQELLRRISELYWAIDPYVRAKSVYDRNGVFARLQPSMSLHTMPRSPRSQ